MAWCLATEIVQVRVADLANSPAMRCDPRLDLNNFAPQISYPRINHQFPNFCDRAAVVGCGSLSRERRWVQYSTQRGRSRVLPNRAVHRLSGCRLQHRTIIGCALPRRQVD